MNYRLVTRNRERITGELEQKHPLPGVMGLGAVAPSKAAFPSTSVLFQRIFFMELIKSPSYSLKTALGSDILVDDENGSASFHDLVLRSESRLLLRSSELTLCLSKQQ